MTTPKIDYVRPEVTALLPRWTTIRDCVDGQEAVKRATTKYLPKPNASDDSDENAARYKQYVERAVFYNATGRTLRGLVGTVFSKDPVTKLPTELELLETDVSGSGVSLEQQAKKTLGRVLALGRAGLLTDFPPTAGVVTRAQLQSGQVRPTIALYDPEAIINWRTVTIGSKVLLSLVVLQETYVSKDDGFAIELDKQWRVLTLEEGAYVQRVWRAGENGVFVVVEEHLPTDSSSKRLNQIPFIFIGPEDNESEPDQPPLYDLAALNIAHYRNSADYEESCYMVGQPTPYFAGLTKDWVDNVLKGTINLGSRGAVPLPSGGSAGLLQASPNTMPKEAMEIKERQMVALGAKLVEQQQVQRTATEANQENASETSVLSASAKNVSAAYLEALRWAARFVGSDDANLSFELNTDFTLSTMTAQERQQLIAEWQGGAITFEEMRFNLQRAGVAYLDSEEAKTQLEGQGNMSTGGSALGGDGGNQ